MHFSFAEKKINGETCTFAMQVVLVALPGVDLDAVESEVQRQCDALPRGATAAQALAHSCIVRVSGRDEAAAFSNRYAPEHLIVNVEDAESWLPLLDNAGSVFLGPWCVDMLACT